MKLELTPQLDFNNVLIRPKRTTIESRSQVNLRREFTFPHSNKTLKVIPIVSANMDTTGTFEIYDILHTHNIITCMNKFYTLEDYINKSTSDNKNKLDPNLFMISTGIRTTNLKICVKL